MIEKTVELINNAGFHARPATQVVKIVSAGQSSVEIIYEGKTVNASSVIMLLTLGAPKGSLFTIRCDGSDEEKILNELVELVNNKFNEE